MQHTKECANCGATFTASRSDARYCSDRCRSATARNRNIPDTLHADLIKTRDTINHLLEQLNKKEP